MLYGFEFKPRLWSSIAAGAVLLLTLWLGHWQLERAGEKQKLEDRFEELAKQPPVSVPATQVNPDEYRFRNVEVQGRYADSYTIYLDNRIYHGIAGYQVITPLQIAGSRTYILINRGWVPRAAERLDLPVIPTPRQPVKISGIAVVPSKKILELSSQTVEGKIWENLVLKRYRKAVPFEIQPIVIEQENDTADGLVRDWERPDVGVNMHRGYAFQWFMLATAIIILYLVLNVKRVSPRKD
ncbi:MAG TPA: SURF1 family protein [Burkholderiales bacterium]|nr:SURF1 family protein [Burkholderiales bacterium]